MAIKPKTTPLKSHSHAISSLIFAGLKRLRKFSREDNMWETHE
jgi:hypothetical protein